MKQKAILFFLFIMFCAAAWSQNRQVTGRVTSDSAREAITGVTVSVRGANTVTTTNNEGQYSITIPDRNNVVLVFSYVGHATREITVGDKKNIDVTLASNVSSLNDVVVVGYTSVRRRDLTGSVSSVGSKQLKDIPLSSAAEALTGKLAGVQVTTTEGAPGADVVIRVRGGGSITQDNSPIYIVDGIQVENALNIISPQDIASVDVLKDASTTAIYGARGANGVVIITTKGGRAGKTQVSYNGSLGYREIYKKMDVLRPYEFVEWQYERSLLQGDTSFNRLYGSTFDTLQNYKNAPYLDWQEEMFGRRAGYQSHNVSVSGGSQSTNFNLSLTANDEKGIQLESGFNRKLASFKLDHRATEKFRVGLNLRYIDQTVKGAGTTNSGTRTTNRLRHSIQYRPLDLPTVASVDQFDEEYYRLSAGISNPVILNAAEYRRAYTRGANISGYFSYQLIKGLTFRSNLGFDNSDARQDAFFGGITPTARNFNEQPLVQIGQQNNNTLNISNTLQYTRNAIKEVHDFDFLLGQELYQTKVKRIFNEVRFFPKEISAENALGRLSLGVPPAGSTFQQPNPTSYESPMSRIISLFGRINYSFDKRILATFTVRGDRSTKFAYDKGMLVFPSGTVAWRFSQEKFMQGLTFINDAKLRVGYGVAGNNRIGDLLYLQLYNLNGQYALNHNILTGYAPASLANPNLQWEKNISQNIGLDLSFLKNRLQFTIDGYHNKGNDLLLAVAIPPTSGYTQQIQNVGSTSNKGVEFQINATPVQKRGFSWNSNFNLSFNRNKVENLGTVNQLTRSSGWQGSDGADDYLVKVGEPIGLMYGFVTDGWYTVNDFNYNATTGTYTLKAGTPDNTFISGTVRPGSMKIKDISGPNGVPDGVISTDYDRAVIGNANPDFIGGWNNQFQYKNFDMSVFMNWVVGNDIYNANKIEWTDGTFGNLNMLSIMEGRWRNIDDQGNRVTDPAALHKLNENAKIWSPNTGQRYFLNDWAIEDGSFLRINNVTIGYTIPSGILQRIKATTFRIYATVNNLATFTDYTGYDPEISTRRSDPLTPGVDFAGYPRAKTFVFGANITF